MHRFDFLLQILKAMEKIFNYDVDKQASSIKLINGQTTKSTRFSFMCKNSYKFNTLPLVITHHINMTHIGCLMHISILYKIQKSKRNCQDCFFRKQI